MTDSTPPRTLRDEIAETVKAARDKYAEQPGRIIVVSEDEAIAVALVASFDIRPHNEPAETRVPEGMTAEKLRAIAIIVVDRERGLYDVAALDAALTLNAWADALAVRDVGGDSPAEGKPSQRGVRDVDEEVSAGSVTAVQPVDVRPTEMVLDSGRQSERKMDVNDEPGEEENQ